MERAMPARTLPKGPPSQAEWEALKDDIIQWYKVENLTLRKTVEILRSRGFLVTEKTLRSRIKQWKLDNKNTRRRDRNMKFVVHHTLEERRPGKADPVFTFEGKEIAFDDAVNFLKTRYVTDGVLQPISRPGTPPGMVVSYPMNTPQQDAPGLKFLSAFGHWFDVMNESKSQSRFGAHSRLDDAVFRTTHAFRALSLSREQPRWQQLRTACDEMFNELPNLPVDALNCMFWHLSNWVSREPAAASVIISQIAKSSERLWGPSHPVHLLARVLLERGPETELCEQFHAVESTKSASWPAAFRVRLDRFHFENMASLTQAERTITTGSSLIPPQLLDPYDKAWIVYGPGGIKTEPGRIEDEESTLVESPRLETRRSERVGFQTLFELAWIKRCTLDYDGAEEILSWVVRRPWEDVPDADVSEASKILAHFRSERGSTEPDASEASREEEG